MKLYTESELLKAIQLSRTFSVDMKTEDIITLVVDTLTPIELPSDEEIEELMNKNGYHNKEYDDIWRYGAKWMKEQILKSK